MRNKLIIGSRGSALALWQAQYAADWLHSHHPHMSIDIKTIITTGDKILDVPLAKIGGQGLFTKELEKSILDGTIDMAVHSLKDMPTTLPDGLTLIVMPDRLASNDALISPKYKSLDQLPQGAVIGTSSLRRAAQLRHYRPDLSIRDLRGNVDTRLRKLDDGQYDAIILAVAGLFRLGLAQRVTQLLPHSICLPAAGQGALALEIRTQDQELKTMLEEYSDEKTTRTTLAERGFLAAIGGSCQIPAGVSAAMTDNGNLTIEGVMVSPDGKQLFRRRLAGPGTEAALLGRQLGAALLEDGGYGLLRQLTLATQDKTSGKAQGKVYLVGAGPGDYRLITLRGKELLERCDVVVYDHLADDHLLAFVPDRAERIYVGKEASHHTLKQDDINALLAEKAGRGRQVVRLKGGDPFVFGRGGEEAAYLAACGIPFEVVPGITSAIAVPAYAGIPVTHRGLASSFAVITGHEDPAKETSHIYWDKLATGTDTLVFLMGVHNLAAITSRLIAHGRPGDTPAALIRWGTKPEQKTWITTLDQAAAAAVRFQIKPPAIFIVGSVVALHHTLSWFENKPLFGQPIIVTRTRSQASKLTVRLEEAGACCQEIPTIRLEEPDDRYASLDEAINRIQQYDWIIFTSTNGVDAFFQRLYRAGKDARSLSCSHLACIGSATADRLHDFGLNADIVPAKYQAESLLEELSFMMTPDTKVLIPRAQEAREVLPDGLRHCGAAVQVVSAYKTVPAMENKERLIQFLQETTKPIITFTSSSTVKHLVALLDGRTDLLRQAILACIGPITAATCREYGLEAAIVSEVYTITALAESIKEWKMNHHEA